MFRFESVEYLYALLLIPLLFGAFMLMRGRRSKKLKKFGNPELIKDLFPDVSKYKPIVKFSLTMLAFAFAVIALANPQIGTKIEEIKREGIDVIIALDISNSMKAEDILPNRLERAKQSISKLVDNLQNDRIGLILFAGEAFLHLPLTSDYSAAKLFLHTADFDIIGTQGTAIGQAIELASESFEQDQDKHKALIIISDGENHEDDAIGAATKAAEQGAVVHTIGMGSEKGAPIPIYSRGVRKDFQKDRDGNVVVSKLDAAMLSQIAEYGNGRFTRSSGANLDLNDLINKIAGMEKKEFESKLYTDYEDRFQYFAGLAILFFIFELLLSERKNRFLSSWNLFGEKKK